MHSCILPVIGTLGALTCCSAAASANSITMHVFNFDFGLLVNQHDDPTINFGDTIHWVWDSGFHSVTSVAGSQEIFNSGNHNPAFTFDHTFTHLGTFSYYCDIHGFDLGHGTAGGMAGTVTVVPAPGPSALVGVAAISFCFRRRRSTLQMVANN